jgi:hypothetical protein
LSRLAAPHRYRVVLDADGWPIMKAEVVQHPGRAPKNNPRFVVTNLADLPERVYQLYCARGDMENRLNSAW